MKMRYMISIELINAILVAEYFVKYVTATQLIKEPSTVI
jgi:hypothetical protein